MLQFKVSDNMSESTNLNSNNNIPDILEVNDINIWSIPEKMFRELLIEYNPEIAENYADGKDVDMRVWSLVTDIKKMLESADVWFITEHPQNTPVGE